MISAQGVIIRLPGNRLGVQADCQQSCKSCSVHKVCQGSQRTMQLELTPEAQVMPDAGSIPGALSIHGWQPDSLASRRTVPPALPAQIPSLNEGQGVQIHIAEEELLRITLLAYCLPCVVMLVCACLGSLWGDIFAAILALAGLMAGVLFSRHLSLRSPPRLTLKTLNPTAESGPVS
ncbi:SoxR reducing system RseC family protein [Oceanospirillum sediminis]|uniref:SoxR reducing system RseC family protein n=1 Tax=Oceanospirillum sediminis TaxID=2760088 RepID=A0A839IPR0_9GAMM|nr:SoxR reducing system RseC family protein [Oceanospirillum sediminis]MBB1486469.1 SoxR reducing system RseC family protein [Oceanospirillum sediminis]